MHMLTDIVMQVSNCALNQNHENAVSALSEHWHTSVVCLSDHYAHACTCPHACLYKYLCTCLYTYLHAYNLLIHICTHPDIHMYTIAHEPALTLCEYLRRYSDTGPCSDADLGNGCSRRRAHARVRVTQACTHGPACMYAHVLVRRVDACSVRGYACVCQPTRLSGSDLGRWIVHRTAAPTPTLGPMARAPHVVIASH